jgi:cell division protein FtsQ
VIVRRSGAAAVLHTDHGGTQIVITGLGAVTQDEVIAAAAVKQGTPLLQVDTDDVAERVATIRRVATASVQREYPSTLRITVVERVPVVVKDYPDGPHMFDKDGVDFAIGPPPPNLPTWMPTIQARATRRRRRRSR